MLKVNHLKRGFMNHRVSSKLIYNGFFNVEQNLIKDSNDKEHPYIIVRAKGDGVVIFAEDDDRKIFVLEEFRYPVNQTVLSLPGGRIELGETHEQCAHRELLEETGYSASFMKKLGEFYPFPSASDQKIVLFLAKQLSYLKEPTLDPLENIQLKKVFLNDLYSIDLSKTTLDGVIGMSLFFYQRASS